MKYGPPRPHSRGKLGIPAAAGVLALSAAGFVGAAAFPAAAAENLCGTVDLAPTGSGEWNVQNNNYSQTGEQCVTPTAAGFTVDKAAGEIAPGGAPKSYPSLVAGCHWGRCTDTPGLPLKASDVGGARTGVEITPVAGGSWNAAYDLWFDKDPNAQGQNEGTELMIWVNGNEAPDPIGKVVGTVEVAGASWKVWQGNIGWDVISFIRETPATSVDLPLGPFVEEAIKRGATEPGDWMTSVQVGFEPWSGGEGLAMDNFTLDLNAAPAKDEQAPAQDQDADEAQDEPAQDQDDQDDQGDQDQPVRGGDQDQAREQSAAPAPTRAPAVEEEQPRQTPASDETTTDAPDTSDTSDEAASTPEPTVSDKAPQAPQRPVEPAPATEQDDAQPGQAPQPPAPTAKADQPAPAPTTPAPTPTPAEQDEDGQQPAGEVEQPGERFVLVAGEPDGEQGDQDEPEGDGARAYREVDVDGRDAAWSLGWGTHSISGTARVTRLPQGEQVSIASLSDADSQALAIATQEVKGKTALVVKVNGTSKGLPVLEADYQVGQAVDFDLAITGGAPQVRLNGDLVYQGQAGDIADSGSNYWKTGPGAPATTDGGEQGRGAQVELSDVSITHESASATAERSEQAKDTGDGAHAEQKPSPRQSTTPPRTRPTTAPPAKVTSPAKVERSAYTDVALADEPAALITTAQGKGKALDAADPEREVAVHGDVATTTAPDGSPAVVLDDAGEYLEVADSPDLSIPTTGQLTVEMLIRPDVVEDLPGAQASGEGPMVAPLVKGSAFGSGGDQEYAVRLYDQDSDHPSPASGYAFDPAGGQGAGSYAQTDLEVGQWTHLAVVYDTENTGKDGWGTVTFYRDGVATDTDTLGGDYEITPADADSPLFIGSDGRHSSFTGAIGPVVITPTALSAKQVAAHAQAALTPSDGQDEPAGKSKSDEAGKDQGTGDEAADGERLIPIPDEDS